MAKIIIAKYSGFCEGVANAYKRAIETAKKHKNVFMLGSLVHNKQLVEELQRLGIKIVKDVNKIGSSSGYVLIPAHGVAPSIYEKAKGKGLKIIDTTCSWVKRAQKIALELNSQNRTVLIVGDEGHPEVKALTSWANNKAIVLRNLEDAKRLSLPTETKLGVIAQTTQSFENFQNVVKYLESKFPDINVHNTICDATTKRQSSAIKVAQAVDVMLVIGDFQSANTKRLTQLCKEYCKNTYQVQNKDEIKPEWLTDKKSIGITAGASTPKWIIDGVLTFLKSF